MAQRDYFEDKVQTSVALLVQCLVEDWQRLNPHEPELQENIHAWGAEFLEHVKRHVAIPKTPFAVDSPYGDSHLDIRLSIPRRT